MTFAENEYQGIEQNGTMKRIPTTKVKQGILDGIDDAINALKGTGYTEGSLKTHEDRLDTLEADSATEGSIAYDIKQSSDALKGTGYTEGSLKTHEDRLGVLENDVDTEGSVLKDIKDTAQDATFTDTSGLDSTTLKDAINEIYAEKAVANGLASLDATGKIPVAQLPVSAMEFKGGWDASSGAYPLTPDVGDFWTVSVAGTTEGVEFDAGDAIVYNGATWDKINKVEIAEEVSYNNSSSGLLATNVQDAIDELDERVDDAETALTTLNADDTTEGSVAKTVKDAVEPIDTRVTYLESVRGHLYGVRMQKISGICSPTYDAIGLEFRPQIDTITNPSDFSSVYPWRDIKTVKVDANKNILCTIDDASFESTIGDIMVKIPVFWHRYWTDANYEYYEISDTPRDGFFAGGFYNPDGTIRPYALVGAVKTSNDGRVPHSWTDTPFTHSLPLYSTTAGFQLDALNKSSVSKWSNIDHQAYEMVWHLIFVEIGGYKISPNTNVLGFDVKGAIGQGINGMTNTYSASNVCTVATENANTFIIAKTRSQYFKVGMLVQIGTAYTSQNIAANRYITDISEYDATNDVITVDGASFTTTLTSTIATWAQPLPLAQLMALKNESGYVLQFGANNLSHVCYRGIWDLWGNMYEFMSGLYRYDLQFYACFDWTKMNVNDPRGVAGWVATGIAPNVANGYLKTRQVYKGALGEIGLPLAIGAGSSTWYAAYAYYFNDGSMGLRAVRCGGDWRNGAYVGFIWSGSNTPTRTLIYFGGRLIG